MNRLFSAGLISVSTSFAFSVASADSTPTLRRSEDITYLNVLKKAEERGLKSTSGSEEWKAFFLQEGTDADTASMVSGAVNQGISSDLYYVGENGRLFLSSSAVLQGTQEGYAWRDHECLRSWGYGACSAARGKWCTPSDDRKSCY